VAGVVEVSLQSWPVVRVPVGAEVPRATVAGIQLEPFHSFPTGGVCDVSIHCWPRKGDVGAVLEAVAGTGTHAEPFHTLKIGGVLLVSYQVAPTAGLTGGVVLAAVGKVCPVAKLTMPPNVVVPSALRVPLATEEAAFRRVVT
jgi:hypothetical protein